MPLKLIRSQKGKPLLVDAGFVHNLTYQTVNYCSWRCVEYKKFLCTGRVHTDSANRNGEFPCFHCIQFCIYYFNWLCNKIY